MDWRQLDQLSRFAVLLNHFQTADALSAATGISATSLRRTFNTLQQGKTSHVLESAEYVEAFRHARHTMTDAMRRRVKSAARGQYEAPILRTPTNVIQPERHTIHHTIVGSRGKRRTFVAPSSWISYSVEHLPEQQIFALARDLFDTFMMTGQFNTFRFEYLADVDEYTHGRVFKDEGLRIQARETDTVKISTKVMGFDAFHGDPIYFEDTIMDEWRSLKLKGALRIVELCFTKMDDVESVMHLVKRDYLALKKKRSSNGGKKRKGPKGRGL